MFQILSVTLLLLYFWYFYSYSDNPKPKPTTPAPLPAKPHQARFIKPDNKINKFQFIENNVILWEHHFSDEKVYMVRSSGDVIQKDDCFYASSGHFIPATGQPLYEYLKKYPELHDPLSFHENSPYTVQQGSVFYFKCLNRKIHSVHICPSGSVFQKSKCIPISSCTEKPDGTLIPDLTSLYYYFECQHGRAYLHHCGKDTFFYHNQCVPRDEIAHFCKSHSSVEPFLLDDGMTRVQCLHSKPVYTRCSPGWKFFNVDECEPIDCEGKRDGTKLALPDRTVGDFTFSPGYRTCHADRIQETVTCPQIWDSMLSKGDNLTHLPMVFDGQACSVPSFCENVLSSDLGTVVPIYEFTKHLRNWPLAELYDSTVGYICEGKGRKRRITIQNHMRINKRFKVELACEPGLISKLPIYGKPDQYFDCDKMTTITCPPSEFFEGSACKSIPENAFHYQGIPFFRFEPFNTESWIQAWNYGKRDKMTCQEPESVHLPLYDICAHPECVPYDFLAMIPDLAVFLPRNPDGARCRLEEATRRLKKEPVDFNYRFWEQRAIPDELDPHEFCEPGQKLKTGNFIFDSTVYATCDETQPFLFCPSTHTQRIIPVGAQYACDTPASNSIVFSETHPPTPFMEREVRRILPIDWDGTDQFKLTNAGKFENLPQDGYVVDESVRMTLQVTRPVLLELRYRVTHPPHIAFEYNEQNERIPHESVKGSGFLIRLKNFTQKELTFPRYQSKTFVDDFKTVHL